MKCYNYSNWSKLMNNKPIALILLDFRGNFLRDAKRILSIISLKKLMK